MKRMLTGWAFGLIIGQIVLLALQLNDSGFVDGIPDLILWFFLFPFLITAPFGVYEGIRPARSAPWRGPLWALAGFSFLLILILLAVVPSLPSLVQLLLVFLGFMALILALCGLRGAIPKIVPYRPQQLLLLALLLVNASIWQIGRMALAQRPDQARVLLFGADGMDWQILKEILANTRLPNVEEGLKSGCRADLMAGEPLFSPILWTTIATGRPAAEHGLCGRLSDLNASYLRCRRIWDIAEEHGRTCGAVQYLGLWPLGPSPSQFAVPSPFEGGL